jgi:hypothetical protein
MGRRGNLMKVKLSKNTPSWYIGLKKGVMHCPQYPA